VRASETNTYQLPVTLRLVRSTPEILHRRHRLPLAERIQRDGMATLRTTEDWQDFSRLIWGDDRLTPPEPERATELVRHGNVIELPVKRRRSTSLEIAQVRCEEERRGKR
jgi:hypothetical protein